MEHDSKRKTMDLMQFADKCLSVFDEVNATGVPVYVTKAGVPVVKVMPLDKRGPRAGKNKRKLRHLH